MTKTTRPPVKSKDVPATQGMLFEVQSELKKEINSVRLVAQGIEIRMVAGFSQIDDHFAQMDARFSQMDARFDATEKRWDARFDSMEKKWDARFDVFETKIASKLDQMLAIIHNQQLLNENQNAQNIYVLDGYTSLNDRLERVETKVFGKKEDE